MTGKEILEVVCPRVLTRRKFCNVGNVLRLAQHERVYISRYTPTLTLPPPIEGEGNNFAPFDSTLRVRSG